MKYPIVIHCESGKKLLIQGPQLYEASYWRRFTNLVGTYTECIPVLGMK